MGGWRRPLSVGAFRKRRILRAAVLSSSSSSGRTRTRRSRQGTGCRPSSATSRGRGTTGRRVSRPTLPWPTGRSSRCPTPEGLTSPSRRRCSRAAPATSTSSSTSPGTSIGLHFTVDSPASLATPPTPSTYRWPPALPSLCVAVAAGDGYSCGWTRWGGAGSLTRKKGRPGTGAPAGRPQAGRWRSRS
jgi:hypothetical protein